MRLIAATLFLCLFWPTSTMIAQHADSQKPKTSSDDAHALREDVNRMKALVQQMEMNLAFVDTTQSPLKHQFQLEIEMWQTVIRDMERRLPPAR